MRIGEMKSSKFLKKEDAGTGKLVTIAKLDQQNVALDDQEPEMKWVIHFQEFDKGMALNWTNIQLIAKALGSDETNDWLGKKIVIYDDPNVSYGGKLTGGIRVRAQKITATEAKIEAPLPNPYSDDVPF